MSHALPITIVPSYPAPTWSHLEKKLKEFSGVSAGFQIDVVAKSFAGSISWPETETDPLSELVKLKAWSQCYQLELDLMVLDPQRYFPVCADLGVGRVVMHIYDGLDVQSAVKEAEEHGLTVSLAATADITLKKIITLVKTGLVDDVQLMGIAEVGQQGQVFDERVLSRIRALRCSFPDLSIAVDGAVSAQTLPLLYAAGANRFAPGSAVIKAADSVAAYKQLEKLVRG